MTALRTGRESAMLIVWLALRLDTNARISFPDDQLLRDDAQRGRGPH
jgi:hypothetical protein